MKSNRFKLLFYVLIVLGAVASFISCSSPTDPFKPYVKNKQVIYSQKPDTLIALSGKKRIILKVVKPSDPQVVSAGIFWGTGSATDSIKAKFLEDKDTLRIEVDSLKQQTYNFRVYTYRKNYKSRSVVSNVSVKSYGDVYEASIVNRQLTARAVQPGTDKNTLFWASPKEDVLGTIVKYVNKYDENDSLFVPADSNKTKIKIFNDDETVSYYTLYLPPSSIDTFYTSTLKTKLNALPTTVIVPPYIIYGGDADELHKGWTAEGHYSGSEWDLKETSKVFDGSYSGVMFGDSHTYERLVFTPTKPLDISHYNKIKVAIYPKPKTNGSIRIDFTGSGSIQTYNLSVEVGVWKIYTIPLKAFGNPKVLTHIAIGTHSTTYSDIYFDNFKLVQ